MVLSTNRSGPHPFKVKMLGSIPTSTSNAEFIMSSSRH